jgi:anion-transporting  ArsA/GET3 family ATPase
MSQHLSQNDHRHKLRDTLLDHRIVVCCGAGGVGKTTTSAALGLAAALLGQKVLVLTIDPARRLAEALGVSFSDNAPHNVPLEGIATPLEGIPLGELDMWMLHPQPVFDDMVERLSTSKEQLEQVTKNPLYQAVRNLISGMQEYMAGESLYQFYANEHYDLLILDTPPSRNAIDFLRAPEQILNFLDSRILKVFAPSESRFSLFDTARKVMQSTFERVAGTSFFTDTQEFVTLFLDMFEVLKGHAQTVQEILASDDSSHLLVTSPDTIAFQEALYFQSVLQERDIPFAGFILNRSMADRSLNTYFDLEPSKRAQLGELSPLQKAALEKLQPMALEEQDFVKQDRELLQQLENRCAEGAFTLASPHIGEDIEDLQGLLTLSTLLIAETGKT